MTVGIEIWDPGRKSSRGECGRGGGWGKRGAWRWRIIPPRGRTRPGRGGGEGRNPVWESSTWEFDFWKTRQITWQWLSPELQPGEPRLQEREGRRWIGRKESAQLPACGCWLIWLIWLAQLPGKRVWDNLATWCWSSFWEEYEQLKMLMSGCHNLRLVLISKFSQNFALEKSMLCFSRHSRQKCRKSKFLDQNRCF